MNKYEITNDYLTKLYENPVCELNYNSPFELLVAVMLSAQCTDKRVNQITEKLFKIASTPNDFILLGQDKLERLIYSCGLYKNKSKNIIAMCNQLKKEYNGQVPNNLTQLQSLCGVGRKTANVVYATAFNGQAIAVDTHVFRVSNRIGVVKAKTVLETEKQLMKVVPKNNWSTFHYRLVLFGRYNCKSAKPLCEQCELKNICSYYKEKVKCL